MSDGTGALSGRNEELFESLEWMHDNVVVSDGEGTILWVSSSFLKNYGIDATELLGKTVFEMEQQGIFYPTVAAITLRNRERTTIVEKNRKGDLQVVTGIPVFGENGTIRRVISFTFDPSYLHLLNEHHEALQLEVQRYSTELSELRDQVINHPGIVARSHAMQKVMNLARKVAHVESHVLITGESGVGKNLIARMIHQHSDRREGPFIEINCGGIPDALLESELFGYVGGAFTGAQKKGKMGLMEVADGGTLILDEIGEMPMSLQVKLLKVIQDKTLTRLGATKPVQVDFRLIAATNRNLARMVDEGTFRRDLYYRIHVVPITIPPLRERREDVLPLIRTFMDALVEKGNKGKILAPETLHRLMAHDWPGNVRELQNIMERLVIMSEGETIGPEWLPGAIRNLAPSMDSESPKSLKAAMEALEAKMIADAYRRCGTTVGVAEELGISQPTAVRKIKKYRAQTNLFNNE